ncbi:MAG: RtcB family protein [bacterium]
MAEEWKGVFKKIDDYRWLLPKKEGMRVPGLIYTSEKMLQHLRMDRTPVQVANVAYLPGIVGKSMAMPDIHWGYGFPIGGVAAMDIEAGGVISPGGIGYDICCGVRLLRTNLKEKDVRPKLHDLISALFVAIPSGVGSKGRIKISTQEVMEVLEKGSQWAIKRGYGFAEDALHTEEKGSMEGADATKVGQRALERGRPQLGTLGAGNHFLEIQIVEEIYDEGIAEVFGIFPGQITVMIHTGSRGLGYQVCDDYLRLMGNAVRKYNISLPDRQLACAPVKSEEGQNYLKAMRCAANYALANRQCIMHWTRETFERVLKMSPKDLGMVLIYDVAHNIGKIEEHLVEGKKTTLCIHRKGATRAFPAGHPDVPEEYKGVGQPVIIPGTMGSASYVLVGTERAMQETWGSTCHGAGRMMSRTKALHTIRGEQLQRELGEKGIVIRAKGYKTLAEEAPSAYKDVNEVVDVCHNAGISKKVARMRPIGVMKG